MKFKGKLKGLNPEKGYGFISGPEGNAFFHVSDIGVEWFQFLKTASNDMAFEYDAIYGPNTKGVDQWKVRVIISVVEEDRTIKIFEEVRNLLREILEEMRTEYEE
jgi:cold shock CspA family protein